MRTLNRFNRHSARGILVSYSGYPEKPNYLMPDNGLANLAGDLLTSGHWVKILDYENIQLITNTCSGEVKKLMDEYLTLLKRGKYNKESFLKILKAIEHCVRKKQGEIICDIAKKIVRTISEENIDFIGFKLWEGPGYKGSITLAKMIRRECPDVRFFAGGPHADLYGERILQGNKIFDAIALGEGEKTILGLAEFAINKRRLIDIPNIMYWNGSGIQRTCRKWIDDLDELPTPCYDDYVYPAMYGNNKIKVLTIDDSRGCPNLCNFCIHPLKSGTKLRQKSVSCIRRDIEYFKGRYGLSCFRFAGSSPSLTAMSKENIDSNGCFQADVIYTAFLHAGDIGYTDIRKAQQLGCYSVFIGLESANPRLLKEAYGKKATLEQMEEAITSAKQAGIYTVVSVIYPGPYENSKTRKDTLSFLIDTKPDSVLVIPPSPLPGTKWFQDYQQYGFVFDTNDYMAKLMEFERPRFLPNSQIDFLCFSLNGKDFRSRIREAEEFAAELVKNGLTIGVSDEAALLALLAGYRGWETVFNHKVAMALQTGQIEILGNIVQKINETVSRITANGLDVVNKRLLST